MLILRKRTHKVMNMRRKADGFSLIEFMIAMAAGMIVISAVVVFTVSTGRGTSVNVRSAKIMQNIRNSLNLIEREIRRSGFDERAMRFVNACSDPSSSTTCPMSQFGQVVVNPSPGSCAVVAYDNAASTTPGVPGAGKYHGFRRVVNGDNIGVVQASLASAAAPDCAAAWNDAAWLDVTDPKAVDITALQFDVKTPLPTSAQSAVGGGCVTSAISVGNSLWAVVQDVNIIIAGQWVDAASGMITKRSLQEHVRVKNDIVASAQPSICS